MKSYFLPLCRFRQYKQDVTQALLKAEYRRSQYVQRQKMLENLSDEMKQDIQVNRSVISKQLTLTYHIVALVFLFTYPKRSNIQTGQDTMLRKCKQLKPLLFILIIVVRTDQRRIKNRYKYSYLIGSFVMNIILLCCFVIGIIW